MSSERKDLKDEGKDVEKETVKGSWMECFEHLMNVKSEARQRWHEWE